MNIKYLKAHNGKSIGDTDTVTEMAGKYLIAMGVAELADEKRKYKTRNK